MGVAFAPHGGPFGRAYSALGQASHGQKHYTTGIQSVSPIAVSDDARRRSAPAERTI
jgi:hypothetical protein